MFQTQVILYVISKFVANICVTDIWSNVKWCTIQCMRIN